MPPPDETWEDIDRRLSGGEGETAEETWEQIDARLSAAPAPSPEPAPEPTLAQRVGTTAESLKGKRVEEPAYLKERLAVLRQPSISPATPEQVAQGQAIEEHKRRVRERGEGTGVGDTVRAALDYAASIPGRIVQSVGEAMSESHYRETDPVKAAEIEKQREGHRDVAKRPLSALAGAVEGDGPVEGARRQLAYETEHPISTAIGQGVVDLGITMTPGMNVAERAPLLLKMAGWGGGGAVTATVRGTDPVSGVGEGLLAMMGYGAGGRVVKSAVAQRVAKDMTERLLGRLPPAAAARLMGSLEAAAQGQGMSFTNVMGPDFTPQLPAVLTGDWVTIGLNSALPGLIKGAFPEIPEAAIARYLKGDRAGLPPQWAAQMDLVSGSTASAVAEIRPQIEASGDVPLSEAWEAGGAGIEPATSGLTVQRPTTEPPANVRPPPAQVPDGPGVPPEQAAAVAQPITPSADLPVETPPGYVDPVTRSVEAENAQRAGWVPDPRSAAPPAADFGTVYQGGEPGRPATELDLRRAAKAAGIPDEVVNAEVDRRRAPGADSSQTPGRTRVFGEKTTPGPSAAVEAPLKPAVSPEAPPLEGSATATAQPVAKAKTTSGTKVSSAARRLASSLKEGDIPVKMTEIDAALASGQEGGVEALVAGRAKQLGIPEEKWKPIVERWRADSYGKTRKVTPKNTTEQRNAIVEENRGLAVEAAKRMAKKWGMGDVQYEAEVGGAKIGVKGFDELLAAADEALVQAAANYDSSTGVPFPGYAKPFIHRALVDAYRENQGTIKLPPPVHNQIAKMKDWASEFRNREGRQPTIEEVFEGVGAKFDDAIAAAYEGTTKLAPLTGKEETHAGAIRDVREVATEVDQIPDRVWGQAEARGEAAKLTEGQKVGLKVRLPSGEAVPVLGTVVRVKGEKVSVIQQNTGKKLTIPLDKVEALRVFGDDPLPESPMGTPRRSSLRSEERQPGEPLTDPVTEEIFGTPGSRAAMPRTPEQNTPDFERKFGGKPISVNRLHDRFVRLTGVLMRMGRIRNRRHAAVYKPDDVMIRISEAANPVDAAHEVGHHFDKIMLPDLTMATGGTSTQFWTTPAGKELVQMGKNLYGDVQPKGGYMREGWAEFFAKYLFNRSDLAKDAPTVLNWFEKDFLPRNTPFKKQLDLLAGDVEHYMSQGLFTRTYANQVWDQKRVGAIKQFLRSFKEDWVEEADVYNQIRKRVQAQLGKGATLLPSRDPFTLHQAYRGTSSGIAHWWITQEQYDATGMRAGPAITDITGPVVQANQEAEFYSYLQATRTVDLKRRKIDEKGMPIRDALRIIKLVERDAPLVVEAARKWWKFHDNLLQYGLDIGGLDIDTFNAIKATSAHYSNFSRDMGQWADEYMKGIGGAKTQGLRGIHGSGRLVRHMAVTVGENVNTMVETFHRNAIGQALINLHDNFKGLGEFIEKVPRPTTKQQVRVGDVKAQIEKGGGFVDPTQVDQLLDVWRPVSQPGSKDPIWVVRKHGSTDWYQVRGDVFRALEGLRPYELSTGLARAFWTLPTRSLRMGATSLNLPFNFITNPLRDLQTFMFNTSETNPYKAMKAWLQSTGSAYKNMIFRTDDPYFQFYVSRGGRSSTNIGQDTAGSRSLGKRVRHMRSVGEAWEWFTESLLQAPEMAPRAAEVRLIAEQVGWKPGQPMSQDQMLMMLLGGRQVTTDFYAGGRLARKWNQMVPFFNAAIQGPRAAARAMKKHKVASLLRGIVYANMAAKVWATYKDEEWYRRLTPQERATYWHFSFGDELIRIPKNFETSQVYGTLVEAALDSAYRKDPKGTWDAVKVLLQSGPLQSAAAALPMTLAGEWEKGVMGVAENWGPPLPKTIGELIANRNIHFDRPIETRSMLATTQQKGIPREERATPHSTPLARLAGDIGPFSAPQADHIIRNLFGGVGSAAARASEGFGLFPNRDREPSDTPVGGRLFRPGGKVGTESEVVNRVHQLAEYHNERAGSKEKPETAEEKNLRQVYVSTSTLASKVLKEVNKRKDVKTGVRELRDAVQDYAEAALAAKTPHNQALVAARMRLRSLAVKYGVKIDDGKGGANFDFFD